MAWTDVAAGDALAEGEVIGVRAGGTKIALFRLEGAVFALYDQCSHGAARLSDGYVEDGCVECPLHQGLIGIRDGAPRSPPVTEPVRSFPAREDGGRILVDL